MICLMENESPESNVIGRSISGLWLCRDISILYLQHPDPRSVDSFIQVGCILRLNLANGSSPKFD